MSDLLDEFVTEMLESGSTGSKDDPDYTPPMYKRTPGKWYMEYDQEKHCTALCVHISKIISKEIHPTQGDLLLMSYAPEMHRALWHFADNTGVKDLLAEINVEPDADLNIPEELIEEVKASRNTGA